MARTRKRLDAKAQQFLDTGKVESDSQSDTQSSQQKITQKSTQKKQQSSSHSSILAEILPASPEKTKRLSVDLPEALYDQLTELSKEYGIPKAKIVRQLVDKALNE
jgi:hypothetical protein